MLGGILFGIGHGQLAASDVGYVERCKSGGDGRIYERACTERVGCEVLVEDVHCPVAEVRRIKVVGASRRGQSQSLVYRRGEVVDRDHRAPVGAPALDGSVFRCKEEVRGIAADREVSRAVKHYSRWISARRTIPLGNADDQSLGAAGTIVEGGMSTPVVGNPPRAGRACGQAPGID